MSARQLRLLALEIGTTILVIALAWVWTSSAQSVAIAPLSDVVSTFREEWLFDRIGRDLVPSLERLVGGYALAVVSGATVGFILGLYRPARIAALPVVTFMRSLPPITLLPVGILLLGAGNTMAITIIAFATCWPVLLNTMDGVAEQDATMLDTARVYGIKGWDRFRFVMFPAVLPRLTAGMRTSLSLAILTLVAAEFLGATAGVGFAIFQAQLAYSATQMWSAVLMLGILGYLLNFAFERVERRVLHWHINAYTNVS